jgi:hypothetical protein
MTQRLDFFTPIGRFVAGDVINKRTKDNDNRPIPEDKQRFEFGVAVEKQAAWALLTEQFYPWLGQVLAADQNALTRMTNWFSTFDDFSMKISDGDKPNSKGVVNEHTRGHFVFWFSSQFAPNTYGPSNEDISAEAIKRGFYVQVAGSIAPNGQPGDSAGIYLNGSMIRLMAEGDEIRGGGDPEAAFGGTTGANVALPPGARPVGAGNGAAGAFGGAPAPLPVGGAPAPLPTAPAPAPTALPAAPGTASLPVGSPPAPHTAVLAGPVPAAAPAPGLPPLPGTGQ